MKVFYTEDQKFEVRPWGGRMCFLATEESAQSKLLGVTAVLRMGQGVPGLGLHLFQRGHTLHGEDPARLRQDGALAALVVGEGLQTHQTLFHQ